MNDRFEAIATSDLTHVAGGVGNSIDALMSNRQVADMTGNNNTVLADNDQAQLNSFLQREEKIDHKQKIKNSGFSFSL